MTATSVGWYWPNSPVPEREETMNRNDPSRVFYVNPPAEDAAKLRRHLRDAHRNLLADPGTWMSYGPLPRSGLSDIPGWLLHAIHEANHAGQFRQHDPDSWLSQVPADPSV